ncbi:MAG TPA: PilZ domain-containing protein, partial [Rhodocyclaceae bacterium]|nr:PilZ domain-containing protein [Rhodocyclaceae bacterium]
MATERREHVRYEPTSATDILLLWLDDHGRHQRSGRLTDLSEGGCGFISSDAPPVDAHGIVRIPLPGDAAWESLKCRIVSRSPRTDLFLISVRFELPSEEQLDQLRSVLASAAYRPLQVETTATRMKYWRVPQWSAFLTAQQLPVMGRSKLALAELEATKGEELAAEELAGLALGDPFLCLTLLREAEQRRSSRLGNETSRPLAAVMQLGAAAFRE